MTSTNTHFSEDMSMIVETTASRLDAFVQQHGLQGRLAVEAASASEAMQVLLTSAVTGNPLPEGTALHLAEAITDALALSVFSAIGADANFQSLVDQAFLIFKNGKDASRAASTPAISEVVSNIVKGAQQ